MPQRPASLLLRLPLELRRHVYGYLTPQKGDVIHITARSKTDERLTHASCTAADKINVQPIDWDVLISPVVSRTRGEQQGRVRLSLMHQDCVLNMPPSGNTYDLDDDKTAKSKQEWQHLVLTCRIVSQEVRDLLYNNVTFSLLGDSDLTTPARFFSLLNPETIGTIRNCHVQWRTPVPMFVRSLASQYFDNFEVNLPSLNQIESTWRIIIETLNAIPQPWWGYLQVEGHEEIFRMDFSTPLKVIDQELREETCRVRWPCQYFTTEQDCVIYNLILQPSRLTQSTAFATTKMHCSVEMLYPGNALARFRRRRTEDKMAERLGSGPLGTHNRRMRSRAKKRNVR